MTIEHPAITRTEATGYPVFRHYTFHCERCAAEICDGEDYYFIGDEVLCTDCVADMRHTAGED